MSRKSPEKPTFTLVAPHYHNGWAYDYVADELSRLGYNSLKVNLPIGEPDMTLDQHATELRRQEREKGASSYIEVGSSWGGDLTYRQLGAVSIACLVEIASPLRPIFRRSGLADISPEFQNLPTTRYKAIVLGHEAKPDAFPREEFADIFYGNAVKPSIKQMATNKLEPHPHVREDDANAIMPKDVPLYYIGTLDDKVFPFARQKATAEALAATFIPFPSGHIPILEKPELLAQLLSQIAEGNIDWEQWGELEERFRHEKLGRVPIQL